MSSLSFQAWNNLATQRSPCHPMNGRILCSQRHKHGIYCSCYAKLCLFYLQSSARHCLEYWETPDVCQNYYGTIQGLPASSTFSVPPIICRMHQQSLFTRPTSPRRMLHQVVITVPIGPGPELADSRLRTSFTTLLIGSPKRLIRSSCDSGHKLCLLRWAGSMPWTPSPF